MSDAITITYVQFESRGEFNRGDDVPSGAWSRATALAEQFDSSIRFGNGSFSVAWPHALNLIRTLNEVRTTLGFTFASADEETKQRIFRFKQEFTASRSVAASLVRSADEIKDALRAVGWERELKTKQIENLQALLALPNGANFSVPGAGKTTVTLALHLLLANQFDTLLVVCPPSARSAWVDVIGDNLGATASSSTSEPFHLLTDGELNIADSIAAGHRRLLIGYEQMVLVQSTIATLLSKRRVHLVLDESHRIKNESSQRGMMALGLGHLAARRDILSGTPMPQSVGDLAQQMNFLWPGAGLGGRLERGERPRNVVQHLYVRTTKSDLDLPDRHYIPEIVQMAPAHRALYAVIQNETLSQISQLRTGLGKFSLVKARQSVIRLMQAAVHPPLIAAVFDNVPEDQKRLYAAAIEEGYSTRILKAVALAERNASMDRKTLIWTTFKGTLSACKSLLAPLNPVEIHGEIPSGSVNQVGSREFNIHEFSTNPNCKVLLATPAAASEGISLHLVCHDAIYVDRSYNATHYLQSIDRIHRLGMRRDAITNITVLTNSLPSGISSIDHSIRMRLAQKIRKMEDLLDDPDLNQLALDEENAALPIEASIEFADLEDLILRIESGSGATAHDSYRDQLFV